MPFVLQWLENNGFGLTASVVAICIGIASIFWARSPSPWQTPRPSHYNECLKIVLDHKGGLNDAETMCSALREKETRGN